MHVLSIIYLEIITSQVCKSQIVQCFTFPKIFEKKREFWDFLK